MRESSVVVGVVLLQHCARYLFNRIFLFVECAFFPFQILCFRLTRLLLSSLFIQFSLLVSHSFVLSLFQTILTTMSDIVNSLLYFRWHTKKCIRQGFMINFCCYFMFVSCSFVSSRFFLPQRHFPWEHF